MIVLNAYVHSKNAKAITGKCQLNNHESLTFASEGSQDD